MLAERFPAANFFEFMPSGSNPNLPHHLFYTSAIRQSLNGYKRRGYRFLRQTKKIHVSLSSANNNNKLTHFAP